MYGILQLFLTSFSITSYHITSHHISSASLTQPGLNGLTYFQGRCPQKEKRPPRLDTVGSSWGSTYLVADAKILFLVQAGRRCSEGHGLNLSDLDPQNRYGRLQR